MAYFKYKTERLSCIMFPTTLTLKCHQPCQFLFFIQIKLISFFYWSEKELLELNKASQYYNEFKQNRLYIPQSRYKNLHNCKLTGFPLTLYILISLYKFSILFSIHFLGCWQGDFAQQSRACVLVDHFLYSHDLNVWFRADIIRGN